MTENESEKERKFPCVDTDCEETYVKPQDLQKHLMHAHDFTNTEAGKISYENYVPAAKQYVNPYVNADQNQQNIPVQNQVTNVPIQQGINMNQSQTAQVIQRKVGPMDESEIPILVGRIKQTLSGAAKLSEELASELYPHRQTLTHFLKRLQLKNLTDEEFGNLRIEYDDIYETKFQKHLEKSKRIYGVPASASVDTDMEFRKSQIQAKLRGLLTTIERSSKKHNLVEEKEKIMHLLNQLSSDALNKSLINQIESNFNDQIKPIIDAVLDDSKRGGGGGDIDDILERTVEELERDYKMNKLNNQLLEQKMYQRQLMGGGMGGGNGAPTNMVPTSRPILDETGEPKRDSKGAVIYEQTYQAPGSPDFGVYHVLASALKRPDNDQMTPLLIAMMENGQASNANMMNMVIAMMTNNNNGPDTEKLMIQLQSESKDTMMEMMKHQSDQQSTMNIELARIRADADGAKDKMMEFQMTSMRKEMEDLKGMAYADPIKRMLSQKNDLQSLGIVTDSRSASVDEKAVEEMGKMVTGIGDKMDNMAGNFVKLIQPIANAQGEILKDRNKLQAPPTYSDEKKKAILSQMITNLETRNQSGVQPQAPPPDQRIPRQVIVTE